MEKPTIISEKVDKQGPHWRHLYRCFCGTEFVACGYHIKSGNTKSCGCYNIQRIIERNQSQANKDRMTKHGHIINGKASRTYVTWRTMIQRCNNPNSPIYFKYGGRGITICKSWLKFENFLADMGERPKGTSLDRINNDGNYEPDNCRWASPKEQAANRRPPPKRKKRAL